MNKRNGIKRPNLAAGVAALFLLPFGWSAQRTALAQTPPTDLRAFQDQQWPEVVGQLEGKQKSAKLTGHEWFQLGYSHYRLDQNVEALEAYAAAMAAGESRPRLLGTRAIALARLERFEEMYAALARAVDAGMPPGPLELDPAFAPIRSQPRFAKLLQKSRAAVYLCEEQVESRQFDFWIGHWDVYANGTLIGTNRITSGHQGCVLMEDYASGLFTGQSMNFYDPAVGEWRQIWIDNRGTVTHYRGGLEDGVMRFLGTSRGRTGPGVEARMSFEPLPDGSVRQLVERRADASSDWAVTFDGSYVKAKPQPK